MCITHRRNWSNQCYIVRKKKGDILAYRTLVFLAQVINDIDCSSFKISHTNYVLCKKSEKLEGP